MHLSHGQLVPKVRGATLRGAADKYMDIIINFSLI